MTPELLTLLMLSGLIILVFLGFPIAFTLTGLSVIFGLIGWGTGVVNLLGTRASAVMTNFAFLAIPLFIFMGCMMQRSGLAESAFGVLNQWLRKKRGGLGLAAVGLCLLFAACTGVIGAAVTTTALMVIKPMLDAGYSKSLTTGLVAAGGSLGILLPPSVMLIVYGPVANVSIIDLFAAAIPPGLLLALFYALYVLFIGYFKKGVVPEVTKDDDDNYVPQYTPKDAFIAFVPFVALIFGVLGVIFFGIAAPTEAAAVGALGSIIIAAIGKKCSFEALKGAALDTMRASTMVMFVALAASLYTGVFFGIGGNRVVSNFLINSGFGAWGSFTFLLVVVFLLAKFLDWLGIVLIVVPIFLPVMVGFGFDALWVSMVIIVLLQTSFLTPPFAYAIFYVRGVAPPDVTLGDIYRGVVPFVIMQLVAVGAVIAFPTLVTFLPALLRGWG